MTAPALTKSSFVSGLRCLRLLWLDRHRPELLAAPMLDRARRETADALASDAPSLFEAMFEHDGVRAVVDVLHRDPEDPATWHLVEVKASTRLKAPRHLQDAAVQAHVLRACGLDLASVGVLHLNRDFVAPDRGDLFTLEDVTRRIGSVDVAAAVAEQKRVLEQPDEPDVAIGSHCANPYPCPLRAHCWEPYGTRTIFRVPKPIHHTRRRKLAESGQIWIEDLRDLDLLTPAERDGVCLIANREVRVDRDALRRRLDELVHPIHFLDFEAIDLGIPRYDGTHPYQHLPFQLSCHVLHEDGRLDHRAYLHEGPSDPRPSLSAALLDALGPSGSIVAFHADYERLRMQELARDLPQHAAALQDAVARLWDQEPTFRGAYVDHRFEGRTSIKKVLPVLCPELTYDGMEVASGTEAMAAWDAAVRGRADDPARTFDALRAYCRQDTWAMVRLHEVLCEEARRT